MLNYIFKNFVKLGLFFYSKRIKVTGTENIPKKGAILFTSNHPNGLLDPLVITTNCPRTNYYLVRAAAFKNPWIEKFLLALNLFPIYRMRDGIKQLAKNQEIFDKCTHVLHQQKTLLIFPEGTHNIKRTVRPLSKGFTRILFGALEKHPNLEIAIVPIGVTYQKVGSFPSKVALHYGTPISANKFYDPNHKNKSVTILKEKITSQLKKLSVHFPNDENFIETVGKFSKARVDFTEVNAVQTMYKNNNIKQFKKQKNYTSIFKVLFIINSIIPYLFWKKQLKKLRKLSF